MDDIPTDEKVVLSPAVDTIVSVSALIDALPDALVVSDANGTIMLVNAQAEFLTGRPRGELVGCNIDDLVPARLHAAHVAHRADFIAEPKTRIMGAGMGLLLKQKNGNEIRVTINLGPLMTSVGMYVLATLRRDTSPKPVAGKAARGMNPASADRQPDAAHAPLAGLPPLPEIVALAELLIAKGFITGAEWAAAVARATAEVRG